MFPAYAVMIVRRCERKSLDLGQGGAPRDQDSRADSERASADFRSCGPPSSALALPFWQYVFYVCGRDPGTFRSNLHRTKCPHQMQLPSNYILQKSKLHLPRFVILLRSRASTRSRDQGRPLVVPQGNGSVSTSEEGEVDRLHTRSYQRCSEESEERGRRSKP